MKRPEKKSDKMDSVMSDAEKLMFLVQFKAEAAELKGQLEFMKNDRGEWKAGCDKNAKAIAEKDKEIKELKASFKGEIVSRLKGKLNYLDKENAKLRTDVAELREYKEDILSSTKSAMDEECTKNEKHCACVPLLRAEIKKLNTEINSFKCMEKDLMEAGADLGLEIAKLKGDNAALKENRMKVDEGKIKAIIRETMNMDCLYSPKGTCQSKHNSWCNENEYENRVIQTAHAIAEALK